MSQVGTVLKRYAKGLLTTKLFDGVWYVTNSENMRRKYSSPVTKKSIPSDSVANVKKKVQGTVPYPFCW